MKNYFALALLLAGTAAFANSVLEPGRLPASEGKLIFSTLSPDSQSLRGDEAHWMLEALGRAAKKLGSTDQKNYEEFSLLGKSLETRGFVI